MKTNKKYRTKSYQEMKNYLLVFTLLIYFNLNGQAPTWSVISSDYEYKMTAIVIVSDGCVASNDPSDIVGVFDIHGVLRGFGNTNTLDNKAIIQINSNLFNGDQLFFKVYDASSDSLYNIYETEEVFLGSGKIGSGEAPLVLNLDSETTANAGPDQEIFNQVSTVLAAEGEGRWSIIEGVGGSFSLDTSTASIFYGDKDESYLLVWTLEKEGEECLAESDEVRITFVLQEREDFRRTCTDGLDNDGDGLTDCNDPDCAKPEITAFDITLPTAVNCSSTLTDGILKIVQTQGDTFSINKGIDFSPDSTFVNVSSGFYNVAVMNTHTQCRTDTIAHVINTAEVVTATQDVLLDCVLNESTPLTVVASNGISPYMYEWKDANGISYAHETPVDAGFYKVTVTDSIGCVKADSFEVIRAANPLEGKPTDFLSGPDLLCIGSTDVEYNVSIADGFNEIEWTPGSTDVSIVEEVGGIRGILDFGIAATSDYLTVSVSNYCSILLDSIFINSAYVAISVKDTTVNCVDRTKINLIADVVNGLAPYQFHWENSLGEPIPLDSLVEEGQYFVTVTDANSCSDSSSLTITREVNPLDLLPTNIIAGKSKVCAEEKQVSYLLSMDTASAVVDWLFTDTRVALVKQAAANEVKLNFNENAESGWLIFSASNYCGNYIDSLYIAVNDLSILTEDVITNCIDKPVAPLTAIAMEGSGPYQFNWKNVDNEPVADGSEFSEGKFYVSLIDKDLCEVNDSMIITQLADPLEGMTSPFLSGPQMLCKGVSDVEYYLDINVGNNEVEWKLDFADGVITELNGGQSSSIDYGDNATSGFLEVRVSNFCSEIQDAILIDTASFFLCDSYSNCAESTSITTAVLESIEAPQVYRAGVSLTSDAIVKDYDYEFTAGSSVSFESGFSITSGLNFVADIRDCSK